MKVLKGDCLEKIVIHKPGDHSVLKIEKFELTDPKEDEIQVRVHYSGINYADICIRWGIYESAKKFVGWPITPGFEFSGIVEKVGPNSKFKIGDKVFGVSLFNAQSSHINIATNQVFHLPTNLTLKEASCVPAVFLTAYHALFQIFILKENSLVLVHSAAGGVGSSLVQLLKARGHRVIGVVGSTHKVGYLEELGADFIIDKSQMNLWKEVERYAPQGLDVVLDANGVATLNESFKHLAPMGKLVVYGFHTMLPKSQKLNWPKLIWGYLKTPRFNPINLTSANKSIIGFNLSFLFNEKEILVQGMEEIIKLFETKKIYSPKVTAFKACDIAKAHQLIESGSSIGKITLDWT